MTQTHETVLMQRSLQDINTLLYEVEQRLFIPKRFRKAPFTDAIRTEYVAYLREVSEELRVKIEGPSAAVVVNTPQTSGATYKVIIRNPAA